MDTTDEEQEDRMLALLDEYLTACESGDAVDLAPYEARAGEGAAELRRQVGIVQQITQFPGLAQEPTDELIFGRFRTKELLGTGSSSRVYLAHDPELDRDIALKVFSELGPTVDRDSIAEARALARLDHNGVVRLFEVGEHENRAFLAMEMVAGTDLMTVLRTMQSIGGSGDEPAERLDNGALTLARQLKSTAARSRLVALVARALDYCHGEGIVHRDIKPENILIGDDLQPTLVDFGLARSHQVDPADQTKRLRGTPAYLAPEQVDNEASGANAASDQFALGTLLYELLSLEHPFRRPTLAGTMSSVSAARPTPLRKVNPALPADAELICQRALSRESSERYPSMSAFADDLEAFVEHRAISVRRTPLLRKVVHAVRRHPRRALLAAAGLIALGLGIGVWTSEVARRRFLAELDGAQVRATNATTPEDFDKVFQFVKGGWMRSALIDDTLAGKLHRTRTADEVESLWGVACERVLAVLGGLNRPLESSQRTELFADFYESWGTIASTANESGPPWKDHDRIPTNGTVGLPEGGELWRFSPAALPALPSLERVLDHSARLPHGVYRYRYEQDGAKQETEFAVHPLEPHWSPSTNSLNVQLAKGMVAVEAGTIDLDAAGNPLSHDPFRISPQLVTWGDLEGVFSADELAILDRLGAEWDPEYMDSIDPAVIPWSFASEYATRVGARLPSPIELWIAMQNDLIELGPSLNKEWTTTLYHREPNEKYARSYPVDTDTSPAHYDQINIRGYHEEASVDFVGFRLATSGTGE